MSSTEETREPFAFTVVNYVVGICTATEQEYDLMVGGWGPLRDSSGREEAQRWRDLFVARYGYQGVRALVIEVIVPDWRVVEAALNLEPSSDLRSWWEIRHVYTDEPLGRVAARDAVDALNAYAEAEGFAGGYIEAKDAREEETEEQFAAYPTWAGHPNDDGSRYGVYSNYGIVASRVR